MPGDATCDFAFVHAADLHLGGRRWLARRPPSAAIRERVDRADRLALGALVDLCLAEEARLLVCAGDIVDGWCRDHRVGLALAQELLRLREGRCEVALVLGNHDVRSRVLRPLLLPDNAWWLGTTAPETRTLDALGVAVHGLGAVEIANETDVAGLLPPPLADRFNIGVLHTSAEGVRGHMRYAPCSRRTLRRHGYDYWALGHVHTRTIVASEPHIVFPGNLQSRGARESGARGAMVARVGAGRLTSLDFCALDAVRFETVEIDVSAATHPDDLLMGVTAALRGATVRAEGRALAVSLLLSGVAGAACLLSLPPARRARMLARLFEPLTEQGVWLEQAAFTTPDAPGVWPLALVA